MQVRNLIARLIWMGDERPLLMRALSEAKSRLGQMHKLFAVLALTLVGCATPYQQNTEWTARVGYESEEIAPDLYRIKAAGNGFTSPQRIKDIVMMRAAEIARDNAAAGFVFVSTEQHADCATAVGVGAGTIIAVPIIRPAGFDY